MKQSKEDFFISILNSNKDKIFRICSSFADGHEHAKDLAQEVYLNIWKSLDSFNGKSHVNTWVYRIALNICLRARTQYKNRKKKLLYLDGIEFQQFPAAGEKEKNFSRLYQCIKKLKETDRMIILLYLEELPYREISGVCGISENYVAVKIKRIKQELFTCLKSKYDG